MTHTAENDARNRIEWHRPVFYRYRVGAPRFRVVLNRYPGVVIGAAVVAGRVAYTVKWGNARVIPPAKGDQ